MNAKAKGSRSERKTRDLLLSEGYYVTKAGGSFGLWDLIALNPSGTLVVQVKTNHGPGREEKAKLKNWARKFPLVSCWIAIVRDRKTTLWDELR